MSTLPYPYLARPGRIGHLDLPHRMIMGAMHLGIEGAEADTEQLAAFYAARARGGAALVITGGVAVATEGVGEGGNYFIFGRCADERALAVMAKAVHASGGRIAVQLFHAGRYAWSQEIGTQPVAPSAIPSRFHPEDTARELTPKDLEELRLRYAHAANRARDLGFDGLEIMGSEGYLLNQFLAPVTNRRADPWGGDAEGRMRFPLEVVSAIRQAVGPDFPVIYRISGADLVEGGTPWEDTLRFARRLADSAVDALDIGIGWHESLVPTVGQLVPRAAFAAIAAGITAAVPIPVIASNRINTPEVAERVLSSGAAAFVSLARPLLADPDLPAKALTGRPERINVCIACNQACLDHVMGRPPEPAHCLVNPLAGRERALGDLVAAPAPKRLAVVGAGPAGLEAARVLAERGHAVTLFEREPEIGGQIRYAVRVPGKGEFAETLRYYTAELRAAGVTVALCTDPSPEDLCAFDGVVIATGVRPRVPDIPGVDLPLVVPYPAVFAGRVAVGPRIAIIGGGGVAADLAHYLSENGPSSPEAFAFLREYGAIPEDRALRSLGAAHTITLMRRGERIAPLLGRTTRWALLSTLRRRGVTMRTGVEYEAITPDGVRIRHQGDSELVPADTVILACGQEPRDDLAATLRGHVPVHVVGGAREAGELDAERAILEGHLMGREL